MRVRHRDSPDVIMVAVRTILSDSVTFLVLGIAAILLKFGNIEPFHRGFYCYDSSIRHPYKVSNVEDTTVDIYQTLRPVQLSLRFR